MAWKTRSGKRLSVGDRVVWCGWVKKTGMVERLQTPDLRYQAIVREVLPNNDDDDGECRVDWLGEIPVSALSTGSRNQGQPRRWLYPFCFELLEDVNAVDRLANLEDMHDH